MKRFFKLILIGLGFIYFKGYSQSCSSSSVDQNPYLCGAYGDANGAVGNWDWELPVTDERYCKMWQARTVSGNNTLTVMGSPFVNSNTDALHFISLSQDYTRAKGWQILRRDFGCGKTTKYPYFVLYNKFSGLVRVYVYGGNTTEYQGVMLQVTANSNSSIYPAILAGADAQLTAPDKYLNPDGGEHPSIRTNTLMVVSAPGGTNGWSVSEFNAGFDPFIQDTKYSNSRLQIQIFGWTEAKLKANITGTSTTSGEPVTNVSYMDNNPVPETTPTGENKYTALGKKFVSYGKSIIDVRNKLNEFATKAVNNIDGSVFDLKFQKTLMGRIKGVAWNVQYATSSASNFGKLVGNIGSAVGAGGQALGILGQIVGFLNGDDDETVVPAPTYSTYNLELNGTITTKAVLGSMVLQLPGTDQTDPYNNATYYRCPLGIFNIKNTPEADVVTYERTTVARYGPSFHPDWTSSEKHTFKSYKLSNNLNVSFNSGAGLELVSAEAAIVGKVLPVDKDNPNAVYDLLQEYKKETKGTWQLEYDYYSYNYMLPDLQSGLLQVTNYDPQYKQHTFQTPYHDLGCLSGLVFNTRKETNVFLRVKAVLKKKNDPTNTPIYYIQDYRIKENEAFIDNDWLANLSNPESHKYPTPYSNYLEVPTFNTVDKVINGVVYNSSTAEIADNNISTENTVVVTSGHDVTFKAGHEVDLEDGFETEDNVIFEAMLNVPQISTSCNAIQIEPFVPTLYGSCYNTAIGALREATKPAEAIVASEAVKVYPVPTNGKLVITGISNSTNAAITILDQSGRTIQQKRSASYEGAGRIDLDVSTLQNGVYFVKIQTLTETVTKKIVVSK